MAETYDIAPFDPTVKQDEELFDSAKETDPQNEFPIGEPTAGFTPSPTPVGLSAQQSFPAPIPPPDPFPFIDEPSAPSEAELRDAWVKLQPNGGLDPETATKYGDVLRRGSEAKKNEDLAKRKEDIKGQYRTPDGVLQMAKDPTVRREMDASPDDDLVIKRALNRSYLASTYNKPNASPEELDQIMRAHSITHWGINNPSHDTFYSRTRDDVLKSDEDTKVWRSMSTTVAQKILEDQLAGKQTSFSETFEKFATANPKVITAQNKDEWYMTGLLMDERLRKLGENVRFPASQLIDIAGKVTAGTATELDWDRTTNALRGVNPTDLEQILKVASIAVREQDPKGEMIKTVVGNIGKRFDRDFNLSKVYEQDRELLLNDQLKNLEAGMTIGKDKNGRLVFAQPGQPLPEFAVQLDQAEYNDYWNNAHRAMDGMAIARVIQQFQEQVVDPVVPYFKGGLLGAAEAGAYDIAGFSKLIPLGLVPGPAGLLSMAKVISASTYHDIRSENPNLPIDAARDWANIDGVFNSVGMKFKTDFLLGRYPFFTSVRQLKGAGRTIEAVMVYGRWAAVHNLEENFEELAQDTLSASLSKLYGDAYPDAVKQKTWGDMLVDIARTRPQVAMAVGPLSLIGAGHATVRDLRNPMRDFMNPDALKSVGLKDEAIAEILASKDLDGAEKLFRQHYNTLTKEDLKKGFEYAAGLTEKDEVDEAMADPAMPTIDPVVMPDGTYKYNVLAPDGTVLSSHTDPDVAETAWVRETERVKGEHWAAEKNAAAQQAAAEAAAAASDEGVAKEAEAKATAETVSPEDRLGTAMTVEFEENAAPTPEESREVSQLQADVAAQGRADIIVLARPSDAQAGPGQTSLDFIRAFERATGKRVVFVASGNDQPLSFTGAVRKGDPNTIFLDAHGDRNVLALVGHEWSHTLEHTSPELHAEMVGRMKPLIIEWAKQEGILAAEVGPEGVTNEMVANIVGDAISNENFWSVLAQKNPSLFEKVRDAVLKFFNQFIGKVQKSEFGTEVFVKDAVQMRDIVADIMDRAGRVAEAAPAGAGVSFAPQAAPTAEQRQEIQFANRRTEKGFYSKLEDFVSGPKVQKVSSPDQVKATINGAGIKAEEIKWSGVMPTIDKLAAENAGKVPKEKLVTHLEDEGSVKFEEVTLGTAGKKAISPGLAENAIDDTGGLPSTPEAWMDVAADLEIVARDWQRTGDRENAERFFAMSEEANRMAEGLSGEGTTTGMPRYATYVLPGGENYREVVLTMPAGEMRDAIVAPNGGFIGWADADDLSPAGLRTIERTGNRVEKRQFAKTEYTSSHFPHIPNYVAHMRLNEREGGLFIEEIQSDRHQQGREKGYREEVKTPTTRPEFEALGFTFTDREDGGIRIDKDGEFFAGAPAAETGMQHVIEWGEQWARKQNAGKVADAPFRKDWHIAMFKRALRDVVAMGQSWIGWTTGETQAERYDLSKQVDEVVYYPNTQDLQAFKGGEEIIFQKNVTPEKLPDVIGKEAADRILNNPSERTPAKEGGFNFILRGQDLKVGGEGMKGFYDKMLPNEVGKYVKQWGGKVEQSQVTTEAEREAELITGTRYNIGARKALIWKVAITPQMKAGVTEGQVMFAPRRGQRMAGAKGEREVAGKGYIEKAEIAQIAIDAEKVMETVDAKMVKAAGGRDKMLAEIKRQVRTDVLAQRIKFPDGKVGDVKSPWSPIVYKGIVFEARETAPGFKAIAAWEKEPYSYEEPPEGVSREEWVNTLAKRSTQQFIERLQKGFGKGASKKAQENAQTILDSIEWYRDFVELVRGEWGGFSDLMADFLGAFSPNQNVRQNWRNAVDAIYGLSHGKYDQLFTELDAWIKSGKTIKDWRKANKPLMRAKSGALFGTNTELGHMAALDMWRAIKRGDAPKAKNFTRNLIGLSIRATIDLWAARLLQRVAEKPRIAGVAKMGIKGAHVAPKKGQEIPIEESVSGQFKFGQDVMEVVADQMRDPKTWEGTGIDGSLFRYVTPADVQAMNWFVEKEIWWDNGWTNDEGSGGSMIYELNQERSSRYVAGLSQEISYREGHADYIPQHPQQAAFVRDIWDSLRRSYPDALAIRVMDSIGSFMGGRERSTDLEMVHGPGMDPDAMMKEILYQAYAKDQSAAFISRVMKPGEADEDGNARPGLEFYFKERVTREQMEPVLAFLRSRRIDGFTLIVDRRTSPDPEGGPNEFWGARLQYIPEFTGDEDWKQKAIEYREAMKIAIRMVDGMQGVAYVGVVRYDTLVLQKGLHYDDNGIYPGALSGSESRAWRRRSIDATAEEATGLAEQAEGEIDSQPLPSGEPGQGRRGRPPPTGQVAFAGRRAAAVEAEIGARTAEPEGRVAFFQKIRDRVLSLIKENDTRREGRLPPEKIDPANELARLDNAVRAKMEGIDRREQVALDKIALRVLSQFNAPADTGIKLQDLENQRQSEIEAAERDWQKTFSRESKNISDLTFQQRLVTFERIRGLERQYKERLRGIRNVYRERGRALLQAVATDKAAAETAIKADTQLASEVEKRFDVERREAERQHEMRQKQIEQRAELRTKIGQQAFESKEARRRLIESIGEFNAMLKALPEELRGKIGGVVEVAKITDEEDMAKFFAQRIARIDEVLEHHLKTEYQERINDLLTTYKPKKTPGGVLKTRIGDAQQVVNDIRAMTKMDDAAVASEIASLEAKINGGLSPEEEAAAHQRQSLLQMFGDLKSRDAATLATSHQFLKTTIAQGRATWGAIEEARLAGQRANGGAIMASLGPSSPAMAAARKDKLDRWKGAAASMYNFGQFMHDIFPGLPFVQSWVDRSRDADTGIQDFMIDVDERFSDLVRRFTGNSVIKGGAALEALHDRTIAVPGGKASKMEAIQYLLSWAQADAQARMVRDGWTDDHIETLRRETDDPLSQAISQFLRKEYDAAYNRINAVYKRMYGMDLPRITNYAPLRYEHSGLPEDVAPFGSPTSISGSTPTFVHARVKHSASLKQMDALTVYMQHMQQAAHFIHYAELVREMRGTLNNGKVKEAIGSNMGPYQADTINKWMDIIARGGTAKATEQLIMKDATAYLTKGTAIGALAFNIKSAVSQLDSAFRWMYEIPPRAWLPTFLKPGWLSSVPQVWGSNAIQRRIHDGMNPISQHLMNTQNLTPSRLLQLTRLGMAPLRYTDAAGTTISSAIVFKYHYDQLIKSGASVEEATEQAAVLMDRAVHKFSQPTSLTSKSIVENTQTGVAKAGLLFMSDPRMKTALLMEAFGDIRRGDVEMGIGKIVAGMAMGALTLFAANLFRDWASDDDDEDIWTLAGFLNAISFGQFHGVFIAGNMIDYIGTSGLAKLTGEKLPYYGARGDILTETYKRAERVLKDPTQLWSDDPEELIKTWENVLRVMGIFAPPVAQLAGLTNVAKTALGISENLEKTE